MTGWEQEFEERFNAMQEYVNGTAINKGWWDQNRTSPELIALMHAELSECLEAVREGNPVSEKIPPFTHAEEELADAIIRIMDMAQSNRWNVAGALVAKATYNTTRPYRHGGKTC